MRDALPELLVDVVHLRRGLRAIGLAVGLAGDRRERDRVRAHGEASTAAEPAAVAAEAEPEAVQRSVVGSERDREDPDARVARLVGALDRREHAARLRSVGEQNDRARNLSVLAP